MLNPTKKVILSISLIICCGSMIVVAGRLTTTRPIERISDWPPVDLSGSYEGTVYFRDRDNVEFVMVGSAKLEIRGNQFTLSNSAGKQIKGEIKASIIPEKDLGVGEIKPENDPPIEIRWHRNPDRRILKIVRAKGAKRLFRFCSNITKKQCMGKI